MSFRYISLFVWHYFSFWLPESLCPSGSQITTILSPAQVMNGIGASGAWWPLDVYQFPEPARRKAAKLLFSAEWLGLTSYRHNIGGGGVGVKNKARAPETPYVGPSLYNYSADAPGSYFLREAAAYGVPILTAFVNSAPPQFKNISLSCGGEISPDQVTSFAMYLANVTAYWRTQGVYFSYISPFNEPDGGFADCGQEGMFVDPSRRTEILTAVHDALQRAELHSVRVMGDESNNAEDFNLEANVWLPSASDSVAVIAHHDYGFASDEALAEMGGVGRSLSGGKDTWFTEICCYAGKNGSRSAAADITWSGGYDPTMISALQLGNLLYRSFTQTLDTHFDWWTALSSQIGCDPSINASCAESPNINGWNDGLIYYDIDFETNGNYALYLPKRFWLLKHFTKAVPLGAVRYEVSATSDNLRVLAFKSSSSWSLIVMNLSPADEDFLFSSPTIGAPTVAHLTSARTDWGRIDVEDSMPLRITLTAESITSVFFGMK